jgi:hypothetical protein
MKRPGCLLGVGSLRHHILRPFLQHVVPRIFVNEITSLGLHFSERLFDHRAQALECVVLGKLSSTALYRFVERLDQCG